MIGIIILVLSGLFVIYICNTLFKNRKYLPPGIKEPPLEKGLPLFGILFQIKPPLHNYFIKLGRKHGNLFRVKFGLREFTILNDFDIIKKTLKEDGDNFSGRWHNKMFDVVNHDSGILFKDGDVWAKHRSFVLKILRDFGFGRSRSLEIVHDECIYLLDELNKSNGKPTDITQGIPHHTANIISKFIMSKRFDHGDPTLSLIEKLVSKIGKTKDIVQILYMIFPVLDQSDMFINIALKCSSNLKMFEEVYKVFQKEIAEHLKVINFNSECEDLIDRFLIKQHQLMEEHGSVDSFTDWQLIRTAFELFIAGYETTTTTLGWSFLFMSKFQDIQDKVYNEIFGQIGLERLPTMNDKKSLNYTQAVMDEILRLSTVAPLAIMHRTFNDVVVDGYLIRKNTLIFPNLFACHRDQKIWEKPLEFYPEHFLTKDDNGEWKYNNREELIPFGIGKRQCLGESLARTEYFVFFVSIIRKFKVRFVEDISESKYEEIVRANDGFLRVSSMNDFIFEKRF